MDKDKKILSMFDQIHAEDDLKKKTTDYLCAEMEKRKQGKRKNWEFAACAVFALFLLCGGFSYRICFSPAAYIDIDVNPSVELTVNRLGKVIRYKAYNDDGKRLLEEVNIYGAGYDEAFEKLVDAMKADGYLGADSLMSVTVQTNERKREAYLLNDLQRMTAAAREGLQNTIEADVYAVTEEVKHCANKNRISPAKYLVIQKLMEIDPGADFNECKEHSVHELQQLVEERCVGHEDIQDTHGVGHAHE